MRDPERIDRILSKLAVAWKGNPGMRLGQLLFNEAYAGGWRQSDLFYLEDEVLASALDQRSAGSGLWQPIETAPKDGTEIDIWVFNKSVGIGGGWRSTGVKYDENGWWEWLDYDGDVDRIQTNEYFTVSHWMPIPGAPLEVEK